MRALLMLRTVVDAKVTPQLDVAARGRGATVDGCAFCTVVWVEMTMFGILHEFECGVLI
ncbi:hypothetical protein [Mycobacterium asiaticum]|uniref:hypothetical protein n=1 Tax=Mycobacterium asiaticum TaxID=1790 RepID=UPI000B1AA7A8|nr:hypothetical protein [Mycobacterium asiaticum]